MHKNLKYFPAESLFFRCADNVHSSFGMILLSSFLIQFVEFSYKTLCLATIPFSASSSDSLVYWSSAFFCCSHEMHERKCPYYMLRRYSLFRCLPSSTRRVLNKKQLSMFWVNRRELFRAAAEFSLWTRQERVEALRQPLLQEVSKVPPRGRKTNKKLEHEEAERKKNLFSRFL